jgi:hypothetical protein
MWTTDFVVRASIELQYIHHGRKRVGTKVRHGGLYHVLACAHSLFRVARLGAAVAYGLEADVVSLSCLGRAFLPSSPDSTCGASRGKTSIGHIASHIIMHI